MKISDLMNSDRFEIIRAQDVGERTFYILDVREASTKYGTRIVYVLQFEDGDTRSLFLQPTEWRRAFLERWRERKPNAVGPLRLRQRDGVWMFDDAA